MLQLRTAQENLSTEKDRNVQSEQLMDDAFAEKRSWSAKEKESEIQIRQFEEYLNSPEIAKKAGRLKQLKKELEEIGTECDTLKKDLVIQFHEAGEGWVCGCRERAGCADYDYECLWPGSVRGGPGV